MAKWIEKQYQKSPLGAVVEDSMTSGSTINAPSINAVQNAFSNPNLLINSDFRNPVNQRGQTSYTGSWQGRVYTIDRWMFEVNSHMTTLTINERSITLDSTASDEQWFAQIFETSLSGTYTVTVNVKSITGTCEVMLSGTYALSNGLNTFTFCNLSNIGALWIKLTGSSSIEIEYIKLEQGSIATPFVPRPYAEELAMCQRFFIYLENTLASRTKSLSTIACEIRGQFPVPMRTTPTLELGVGMYRDTGAGQNAATIENVYTNYQAYGLRVYFGNVLDGTSNAA